MSKRKRTGAIIESDSSEISSDSDSDEVFMTYLIMHFLMFNQII